MKKVLHILNEIRPSGAEVMIKKAVPYWSASGWQVHVLGTRQAAGSYAEDLARSGVIVHHIPFSNSINAYSQFVRLIRLNRFDVVHIHTEGHTLTFACLARLAGASRVIRTIHNNFLFTGITRLTRAIRRWAVRRLGVIQVSISNSVQENELIRFGNPTERIDNWYDDAHFRLPTPEEKAESRLALGLSGNEKVILSVGNCSAVKNHRAILQALAKLNVDGQRPLYWHVGEEDEVHSERPLVREYGLEEQVRFWGQQEDVRPFLWGADVFVMPSIYEGFGVALIEAAACGLSLVLARSPGLDQWASLFPEVIYTETKPAGLARGLGRALGFQTASAAESQAAVVKDKFSTGRGVQEYIRLYGSESQG